MLFLAYAILGPRVMKLSDQVVSLFRLTRIASIDAMAMFTSQSLGLGFLECDATSCLAL